MTTLQITISIWFLCTLFIVMLALRLDNRQNWSWFSVFSPMFILDLKLLAIAGYEVYTSFRRQLEPTCPRELLFLLGVLMKAAFQLILCIRLDYVTTLPWTVVTIPLWASLIFLQANILVPIKYFCGSGSD